MTKLNLCWPKIREIFVFLILFAQTKLQWRLLFNGKLHFPIEKPNANQINLLPNYLEPSLDYLVTLVCTSILDSSNKHSKLADFLSTVCSVQFENKDLFWICKWFQPYSDAIFDVEEERVIFIVLWLRAVCKGRSHKWNHNTRKCIPITQSHLDSLCSFAW